MTMQELLEIARRQQQEQLRKINEYNAYCENKKKQEREAKINQQNVALSAVPAQSTKQTTCTKVSSSAPCRSEIKWEESEGYRLNEPAKINSEEQKNKLAGKEQVTNKDLAFDDALLTVNAYIENAVSGIKAYQKLPRTIFHSHLSIFSALFDNDRGTLRANSYHAMLTNPDYHLSKKCIILLALLQNTDGKELKKQVSNAVNRSPEIIQKTLSDYLMKYNPKLFEDIHTITKSIIDKTNNKPDNKAMFVI